MNSSRYQPVIFCFNISCARHVLEKQQAAAAGSGMTNFEFDDLEGYDTN
jgi:hypothetical protein